MIHTTVIKSLSRGVLQFQRFHVKLLHFTHMSILCKIFGNSGSNSGNNETNVVRVRGIPRPNQTVSKTVSMLQPAEQPGSTRRLILARENSPRAIVNYFA